MDGNTTASAGADDGLRRQQERTIQDVCGVSAGRARELLDASPTVESAIDLHFSSSSSSSSAAASSPSSKRRRTSSAHGAYAATSSSPRLSSPSRTRKNEFAFVPAPLRGQQTLDKFFGVGKSPKPQGPRQTTLEGFFGGGSSGGDNDMNIRGKGKEEEAKNDSEEASISNNINEDDAARVDASTNGTAADALLNRCNVAVKKEQENGGREQGDLENTNDRTLRQDVVVEKEAQDDFGGDDTAMANGHASETVARMGQEIEAGLPAAATSSSTAFEDGGAAKQISRTRKETNGDKNEGDDVRSQRRENLSAEPEANDHKMNEKVQHRIDGGTLPTQQPTGKKVHIDAMDMSYSVLVETFVEMSSTSKRTIKMNALKSLFLCVIRSVGGIRLYCERKDDDACTGYNDENAKNAARILACTMDLVLGKLSSSTPISAPSANDSAANGGSPLQVSGRAVSTAVKMVTGASRNQLRQSYRALGDMGDVAAQLFTPPSLQKRFFVVKKRDGKDDRRPQNLSVVQVHELLQSMANVTPGKGSQKERLGLIVKLLRSCENKEEIRFLVRTMLGNMRLGASLKSVVAGLAMAFDEELISKRTRFRTPAFSNSDPIQDLQRVFNVCPRVDVIAHALVIGGIPHAVQHCSLQVGFPFQPMLANPAHSLDDVEKFMKDKESDAGENNNSAPQLQAVAEWKYDGVRCQAHYDGKTTKLFSRHMLENTDQYPDAVLQLMEAKGRNVRSFVIDSEIVAVARCNKGRDGFRLLPFQDLSTRRGMNQKQRIEVSSSSPTSSPSIQVRVYAFDLMYLNGESLIGVPLWERQEALRNNFKTTQGFAVATSVKLDRFDQTIIERALQQSFDEGAEGLMIKLTGFGCGEQAAHYEPGKRGQLWLKLKRDYVIGFADTIDVVPIGAWFGNGRKAQKGFLSPVLLAVYDDDEGAYRSISRCMSFSDDMYTAMREFYFRGTPYPSGVGVGEAGGDTSHAVSEPSCTEAISKITVTGDEESENGDAYTSGVGPFATGDAQSDREEDSGDEDSSGDGDRVNCFTRRPSSAYVITNENCSIWFKPSEVWEVSFADMTLSRTHTAAQGLVGGHVGAGDDDDDGGSRGVALRFPRFVRRRLDKSIDQATTSADIARMFRSQSKVNL